MLTSACASSSVPDPRSAASAYARAAKKGDADALYDMLSESAKRERTRESVRADVKATKQELADVARDVTKPNAKVDASAQLRLEDGERVTIDMSAGEYRVGSAGLLPGPGRSPEEALETLRRAVSRRSYPALMRILSPATRAAIEADMRSLVTGLERVDGLVVRVNGDVAEVSVPGGHHVKMRRESGLWTVEDFD